MNSARHFGELHVIAVGASKRQPLPQVRGAVGTDDRYTKYHPVTLKKCSQPHTPLKCLQSKKKRFAAMQLTHRLLDGLIRSTVPCALVLMIGYGVIAPVRAAEAIANTPSRDQFDPQIARSYRIGTGDELNFRFFYTPELNTVAVVRSDGRVTLPLIGELPVVGRTLGELAGQVEQALSERVRRPQVAINVQGPIASQRVFVGGEVGKPGVQPLVGPLTVMQAVMAAEGFKDSAQPREVMVLRSGAGNEQVATRIDLSAVMEGRDGARDIALAPYDVVIVPRSGIANVGVWVDQYIRRVLPIGFGFSYSINGDGGVVR